MRSFSNTLKCFSIPSNLKGLGEAAVFSSIEGQRAIVMVLCPSYVRPFVRAWIRKLFFQKTSPQKPLTRFLPNFTGMSLRWFSFKLKKKMCSMKKSGYHGNESNKPLKILSSQTAFLISLLFCRNVP